MTSLTRRPRLATLLLLLALGRAAVVLGVFAAAWVYPLRRVADLRAQAVAEANALLEPVRERPVHRHPAASGTFGERAAAHLPPLAAAIPAGEARSVAKAVAKGERPLADLPPEVAAAVTRAHGDLAELLAGTRAPLGKLPVGWCGLRGETRPISAAVDAADLVAIEARQALARGQGQEALALCADGLALGRDLALSSDCTGLLGALLGVAAASRLAPACAEAASADPVAAAGMFRATRDGWPSFAEGLQRDLLCMELMAFTRTLGDRRAGLGPNGRACLLDERRPNWNLLHLRLESAMWREYRPVEDALVAAARLEGAARRRAIREATGPTAFSPRSLLWLIWPKSAPDFDKYALRHDALRTRLAALLALSAAAEARGRSGEWPVSVEALVSAGALSAQEARPLAEARLERQGDALLLTVPLPQPAGEPPERVTLRATPPPGAHP